MIPFSSDFPIHEFVRPHGSQLETIRPFWQVSESPEKIYVQGSPSALLLLDRLPKNGFAIVGTRNPQARSRALVKKIVRELQGTSLIILSGFARGIDTEAHLTAIEIGLPTIAILGTGLESRYPLENSGLRQKILETGGLIISEFPEKTKIYPSNFTQRNRLIAGWAEAVWVVEAGHPSGALNTAKWARNQYRTCYATPCFPDDYTFTGNQGLLDRDEAIALWRTESLGHTWSDLSTSYSTRKNLSQAPEHEDLTLLLNQINSLSSIHGGASVQQILNWALSSGWSPQHFFSCLQKALEEQKIYDYQGILVTER